MQIFNPFEAAYAAVLSAMRKTFGYDRSIGSLWTLLLDWRYRLQETDLADETVECYVDRVERFIDWLEDGVIIEEGDAGTEHLRSDIVALWFQSLAIDGKRPSTVRTYFNTLHRFMRWLESEGFVAEDPMNGMVLR